VTDRAEPEGGENACWLPLVCDECGALEHDGHRPGCSHATTTARVRGHADEPDERDDA
jgi:hypothetical protein